MGAFRPESAPYTSCVRALALSPVRCGLAETLEPGTNVLFLFFPGGEATIQPMLFETPYDELSDEEIAAVLRQSMASAGHLSRRADVYLAGVCADHLVDAMRAAGLVVIRPAQRALRR